MKNLIEAIRNNFDTLVIVRTTSDGFEVIDVFTNELICGVWLPSSFFDTDEDKSRLYCASFSGLFKGHETDAIFPEKVYQAVREYIFEK